MYKELIISIVLVSLIFLGEYLTQNYTQNKICEISNQLLFLKEKIKKNDKEDREEIKVKIEDIEKNWEKINEKMSYYLEHDELEKVKDKITNIKSCIENVEYIDSIKEIDSSIFILNHIEEKNKLNLKNIF